MSVEMDATIIKQEPTSPLPDEEEMSVELTAQISRDTKTYPGTVESSSRKRKESTYEYEKEIMIQGPENPNRGRRSNRIDFTASIPYGETKFWEESGYALSDEQEVSILGGKLIYTMTNISGPPLIVDIYDLFDRNLNCRPEVLENNYVPIDWDPLSTILNRKFKIRPRMRGYVLRTGESLSFSATHLRCDKVKVGALMKRAAIPCYLAVLEGLSRKSDLNFSFSNSLRYVVNDPLAFVDLSPWDED